MSTAKAQRTQRDNIGNYNSLALLIFLAVVTDNS